MRSELSTTASGQLVMKTCKMCCMEIPEQARKCPCCQHFQSRLVMALYHPFAAVLLACVPLAIFVLLMTNLFDTGEDFQRHRDAIRVTESKMALGETKSGETVAILGTLTNGSPIPWSDVRLSVEVFDANGVRIDAKQDEQYAFHLPAHDSAPFKISFRREFPETNYHRHAVRLIHARDGRTRF